MADSTRRTQAITAAEQAVQASFGNRGWVIDNAGGVGPATPGAVAWPSGWLRSVPPDEDTLLSILAGLTDGSRSGHNACEACADVMRRAREVLLALYDATPAAGATTVASPAPEVLCGSQECTEPPVQIATSPPGSLGRLRVPACAVHASELHDFGWGLQIVGPDIAWLKTAAGPSPSGPL